ncbi:GIY-YIG nuclease family protein [Streptomyces indiaensis]|uniref:Bacteriophage T5 Orf172 DNA-binding domain-containing protein n=1 Tax=Streptomyces indiaensis TaxID=284033 RepID=A0ABN3EMX3_9ACTN
MTTGSGASGHVYVIGEPGSSTVKIGFSKAPEKRLWFHQGGSPVALSLVATFEGDQYLEAELHRFFSADHVRGEWFRLGDRPVEKVRAAVALGIAGMRAGRAANHAKRQRFSTAQVDGVDLDVRFPPLPNEHVRAALAAHGIALDLQGSGEVVFHQCDSDSGCVDCRAGRLADLGDLGFVLQETGREARSWDERFPERRLPGGN